MTVVSVKQALSGAIAGRQRSHRPRLGAHPARFQGRAVVRQRQRRLVLRSDPGRRAGHAGQLRRRDPRLTAGCAVIADRQLVPSQGKGQAFEIQATQRRSRRLGRGSGNLSDPAQGAFAGIPARGRAPAPAHEPVRRGHARAPLHREGDPPLLPRAAASSGSTRRSSPTSDAEGAGQMFRVSTLDMANLPRDDKGAIDFAQDFFGKEAFLTVSGQLNVEGVLPGAEQGLHVRPDLPRRELEHARAISPSSG